VFHRRVEVVVVGRRDYSGVALSVHISTSPRGKKIDLLVRDKWLLRMKQKVKC
jgi:hypothetical protein